MRAAECFCECALYYMHILQCDTRIQFGSVCIHIIEAVESERNVSLFNCPLGRKSVYINTGRPFPREGRRFWIPLWESHTWQAMWVFLINDHPRRPNHESISLGESIYFVMPTATFKCIRRSVHFNQRAPTLMHIICFPAWEKKSEACSSLRLCHFLCP